MRLAEASQSRRGQMKYYFAAVHESVVGTELPIPNVRSSVANGGKADKICSMRVLRILDPTATSARNFCCDAQRRSSGNGVV